MISKNYNINADLGEGYNIEKAIMPYLNSCNIACGGHSGDLNSIKEVEKVFWGLGEVRVLYFWFGG